jgi:hypothetical protein
MNMNVLVVDDESAIRQEEMTSHSGEGEFGSTAPKQQ